jgi:hypothetical protein
MESNTARSRSSQGHHQSDATRGVTNKFQRHYDGPFHITNILNPSIFEISDEKRIPKGLSKMAYIFEVVPGKDTNFGFIRC